jgi:hypothetical protein
MFMQFHQATIRDMTPLIAMPASLPDPETGSGAVLAEAMPALPALSAMLRGATRLAVANDWRSGVLEALSIDPAVAPAGVAASAIAGLQPGACICLVMPVHAIAGISRMFLATADQYTLEPDERETLRAAFNAEFGAPDLQLHAAGTGWVLQAPFAVAADDASPELLVGAALAREPARTDTSRALRRLGAEVEMWLATLPLNLDRQARGHSPINSFWFWGGTMTTALPQPGQRPRALFSNLEPDAWLAGLASHCGLRVQQAQSWADVRDAMDAVVILQSSRPGESMQDLPAWESAWLDPAFRDIQSRRLPALRVQWGASAWLLPAPRLTRWLRRSRPWWEMLSA